MCIFLLYSFTSKKENCRNDKEHNFSRGDIILKMSFISTKFLTIEIIIRHKHHHRPHPHLEMSPINVSYSFENLYLELFLTDFTWELSLLLTPSEIIQGMIKTNTDRRERERLFFFFKSRSLFAVINLEKKKGRRYFHPTIKAISFFLCFHIVQLELQRHDFFFNLQYERVCRLFF